MSKEKKRCEHCDRLLSEDEVNELDGKVLCEDCYNEESDLREVEEGFI
jgi:formylmethanofuran dehydrogenase subunit E